MAEPTVKRRVEICPPLIVEYEPDTGTLSVCTQKQLGVGFSVTPNLVVFYDPLDEDCPVGFIMHSAQTELNPFLDAVLHKEKEQQTG